MKDQITFAGVDISCDWIDICLLRSFEESAQHRRFDNTPAGHEALLHWLGSADRTRIAIEATGPYSLDLTLSLYEADLVEVMVVNPRAIKKFAGAQMRRSKTDKADATTICEFAKRMPFVAWEPPTQEIVELRAIARRIQALTVEHTRERARLHSARASRTTPRVVANDIEVNLRHLQRRIEEMTRQAMKLVRRHAEIENAFGHLSSVRGFAEKSTVLLLSELLVLPSDMTARQWVAHAGLDVRLHESGRSVEASPRMSKVGNVRIRRALYMPALVAVRWEPNVKAFYEKLLGRGKQPKVALGAVMRKLLHSIYGMLKHDTDFDGEKFYRPALSTS